MMSKLQCSGRGHETEIGRPPRRSRGLDRCQGAFSLLEVIVAVGVFAVGMIAILGLFSPVARSVGNAADADAAARVADALRTRLQAMPFADVAVLLKGSSGSQHALSEADARSDYNPATDPQILFANRDGTKIGAYADAIWVDPNTRRNSDREKFYEIALVRNETISPLATTPETPEGEAPTTPANPDTTAFLLGYVARLRWPAFVPDGGAGAIQVGSNPTGSVRFDHSSKQVMFFTGAITR